LIDEAVRRVLTVKMSLRLLEDFLVEPEKALSAFDALEHRSLVLKIARESIVLFKNEGGLLPLKKDIGSIAVTDGIRAKVSEKTIVRYAKGCEVFGGTKEGFTKAVEVAKNSDVAIVEAWLPGEEGGNAVSGISTSGTPSIRADIPRLSGGSEQVGPIESIPP